MPTVTVAYLPGERVVVRSGHQRTPAVVENVMLADRPPDRPLGQRFFCRLDANPDVTAWYEVDDLEPPPAKEPTCAT